ncbi:YceI family protein [Agrococcus sp. Marseille-Q4369]|uniref:YceI family protein n=1 Tax=Agrococcus sp. Marseille-Q4369 TaxID=2810513 RepID=UPI001B8C5C23|nr:YceI family protein [Agrococcus sp. Marseille-Q4369]QUW19031.1 YceI family protein [Agrococcus sp. Marseille-Q4369]
MLQNFPGYQPGTYVIDGSHSNVTFSVRHMMVAKVRGEIEGLEGTIVLAENPEESTITATVDPSTINTKNADRDQHLRSNDFFAIEEHPEWTFVSTSGRVEGDDLYVDGDLTLRGVTKRVALLVEFGGIGPDTWGNTRAGASARTRIKRSDFGISWNVAIETGGVMLSDEVDIEIEISAIQQAPVSA